MVLMCLERVEVIGRAQGGEATTMTILSFERERIEGVMNSAGYASSTCVSRVYLGLWDLESQHFGHFFLICHIFSYCKRI